MAVIVTKTPRKVLSMLNYFWCLLHNPCIFMHLGDNIEANLIFVPQTFLTYYYSSPVLEEARDIMNI